MANTPQTRKRVRQTQTRYKLTASQRTQLRSEIKKVRAAIASGDIEASRAAFLKAQTYIDRYAARAIIHRNAAARIKSRLNAAIKKLAA